MIHKTEFFDNFIVALQEGRNPEMPTVGSSYAVCGYNIHLETSLSTDPTAYRCMARLCAIDVRCLHIKVPARRIRGPLCLLPLLVNGRVADLFCAELFGGLVVLAIYWNRPLLAYTLVDKLRVA